MIEIVGKDYLLNLTSDENVFQLSEKKNKEIINRIISKHTDWAEAAGLVLKNTNSYNSSLYMILFAIADVNDKRFEANDISFNDLENTVRRIAKYDLRKIAEYYEGLAMALHYWSCVYRKV